MKLTKTITTKIIKNPEAVLKTLDQNDIASIIQQTNYAYYNSGKPLVPDEIFDIIKEYLEKLNPKHPILKNVGSMVGDGDKKIKLPYFMASLDKIKADEKVLDRFKKKYRNAYVISDKLDGNSAMIFRTSNSTDVKLCSRGDGEIGQDITHLLPFIRHVPSSFPSGKTEFAVRGELICSKADFLKFANKMANARNMVAGQVNAKLPDLEITSNIQFVAYELVYPVMKPDAQFKEMKKMGYKCVIHEKVKEADLTSQTLSTILTTRRESSEFEIDGIVVMHNDVHERSDDSNPDYGFAFKSIHTMSSAEVIVTNVDWNITKDSHMVPVINFNEVSLGGVKIKRAHGFNGKFVKDNVIGPGSKIVIIRSGDVIPYVKTILAPSSSGEPQLPTNIEYGWSKTGVDIVITKASDGNVNPEVQLKTLTHFFEKIDVPGLSKGNIKKLFDAGNDTVASIFNMSKEDFLKIDGFKERMADKLHSAIQGKKETLNCITLMAASNTLGRGFGETKIELITDVFPTIITEDYIPTEKELVAIKGIQTKTAEAFITNLPAYFKFKKENGLDCLYKKKKISSDVVVVKKKPGVGPKAKQEEDEEPSPDVAPSSSSPIKSKEFEGMNFVFTGFRSKVLESFIEERGGHVKTSISKTTNTVIRKDGEDSTKTQKAEKLGVTIVDLSTFEKKHGIKAK